MDHANSSHFSGDAVRTYAERPPRQVPGFDALHRMTSMLLAERTPTNGKVLVVGAGGGLELQSLAERNPGWTFDGVDPSADMLDLARVLVGDLSSRMQFHKGYASDAPDGPYDAATCLLVFHHVPFEQRLETLRQIRARLKPGAPFVMAHVSFGQSEPERTAWIERHIAYGAPEGFSEDEFKKAKTAMRDRLFVLSPEDEIKLLHKAGFLDVTEFYAALSFRGWVACA